MTAIDHDLTTTAALTPLPPTREAVGAQGVGDSPNNMRNNVLNQHLKQSKEEVGCWPYLKCQTPIF